MTVATLARAGQRENYRNLLIGFATSLALHLFLFAVWFTLGLILVASHRALAEKLREQQLEAKRRAEQEPPLMFVEVMPEQATPEPPKETPYYSSANSRAANTDVEIDANVPRIEGTQDKVLKTVDTLRPQPQPLQPAPPPADPAEAETRPKESPGDLALLKPPDPGNEEKRQRPRTIVEARIRQGIIAGEKKKQEGGVRRQGVVSLDARATAFGVYDAALVSAIQKHWYDVLDENEGRYAPRPGKVEIEFRLHYDGRISDLKVTHEDVGDILAIYCRKAIADPAPYSPWPSEMRRMIGKDYRDVKFTFYYM